MTGRRLRSRSGRLLSIAAVLTASFAAALSIPVGPASAYPFADIDLVGHGWGHGMGMGQWGALGYSLGGSSYQQILSTYYGKLAAGGNTSIGKLAGSGGRDQRPRRDDRGRRLVAGHHFALAIYRRRGALRGRRCGSARRDVQREHSVGTSRSATGGCSASSWGITAARNVVEPDSDSGRYRDVPGRLGSRERGSRALRGRNCRGTARGHRGHREFGQPAANSGLRPARAVRGRRDAF